MHFGEAHEETPCRLFGLVEFTVVDHIDGRFFELLLGFDWQIAEVVQADRCGKCGAALHWGRGLLARKRSQSPGNATRSTVRTHQLRRQCIP
jgi:hypothetical protein